MITSWTQAIDCGGLSGRYVAMTHREDGPDLPTDYAWEVAELNIECNVNI